MTTIGIPPPTRWACTRHLDAKIELLAFIPYGEGGSQNGYYDGWCGSGKVRLRGLRGRLRRSDRGAAGVQLSWLGTLPTGTVIGMEACGSTHHWGRTAQRLGLAPGLMAAEFVRPYCKRQSVKNDRADAEAILVALPSPGLRFIPVKTKTQQ